jgi:hypothetical protein
MLTTSALIVTPPEVWLSPLMGWSWCDESYSLISRSLSVIARRIFLRRSNLQVENEIASPPPAARNDEVLAIPPARL